MASALRKLGTAAVAAAAVGSALLLPAQALAATSHLSTPASLVPNSDTSAYKDPVLSWQAVAGATGYQVELSKSNDFSLTNDLVALPDKGNAAVASYAVPQTLVHGDYYWRVRATGDGGNSAWSGAAEIVKGWNDEPSIAAATPTAADPTLQWTAIPDASSYEVEYSIYPTFNSTGGKIPDASTTLDCLTTNTSFTPYSNYSLATADQNVDDCDFTSFNPNGDTPIYWRVRGIDDSQGSPVTEASQTEGLQCFGNANNPGTPPNNLSTPDALGTPSSSAQECSQWSTTGTVGWPWTGGDGAVGADQLGTVSAVNLNCGTPSGSHYNCTGMPTFSWGSVNNASSYVVTIADDPAFSNVERMYETPFTTLTPRDQLADKGGQGYFVSVQACTDDSTGSTDNNNGCTTGAVATFTKHTPTVTGLTATHITGGERLAWNDLLANYDRQSGHVATEPESYEVQVTTSNDQGFDSPVVDETVDASCDSAVMSCYQPSGTSTPGQDELVVNPNLGTYIWRVLPIDLTGNVLPAAVSGSSFAVKAAPAVRLTTSSGVAVNGTFTVASSQPLQGVVTGDNSPSFKLQPASGGSAVVGRVTKVSDQRWQLRPNTPLATGQTYSLVLGSGLTNDIGNAAVVSGSPVRTTTKADDTSAGWTSSGHWSQQKSSNAKGGSYVAAGKGATATLQVAGSKATLFGCKAPRYGTETVTVDGHRVATVSLTHRYTECGVRLWSGSLKSGQHTVRVRVTKGTGDIDAVDVS